MVISREQGPPRQERALDKYQSMAALTLPRSGDGPGVVARTARVHRGMLPKRPLLKSAMA